MTQGQDMTWNLAQAAVAPLELGAAGVVRAGGRLTLRAGHVMEAAGAPGYHRVEGGRRRFRVNLKHEEN